MFSLHGTPPFLGSVNMLEAQIYKNKHLKTEKLMGGGVVAQLGGVVAKLKYLSPPHPYKLFCF